MCGVTKLDNIRNERISGANRKESAGKEIEEVVWACHENRGALRRKEGDGNESTREKEERKPKRRWLDKVKNDNKEKVLSADKVYDRATWRRITVCHRASTPHKSGTTICRMNEAKCRRIELISSILDASLK